jgi:hypothetical protein
LTLSFRVTRIFIFFATFLIFSNFWVTIVFYTHIKIFPPRIKIIIIVIIMSQKQPLSFIHSQLAKLNPPPTLEAVKLMTYKQKMEMLGRNTSRLDDHPRRTTFNFNKLSSHDSKSPPKQVLRSPFGGIVLAGATQKDYRKFIKSMYTQLGNNDTLKTSHVRSMLKQKFGKSFDNREGKSFVLETLTKIANKDSAERKTVIKRTAKSKRDTEKMEKSKIKMLKSLEIKGYSNVALKKIGNLLNAPYYKRTGAKDHYKEKKKTVKDYRSRVKEIKKQVVPVRKSDRKAIIKYMTNTRKPTERIFHPHEEKRIHNQSRQSTFPLQQYKAQMMGVRQRYIPNNRPDPSDLLAGYFMREYKSNPNMGNKMNRVTTINDYKESKKTTNDHISRIEDIKNKIGGIRKMAGQVRPNTTITRKPNKVTFHPSWPLNIHNNTNSMKRTGKRSVSIIA